MALVGLVTEATKDNVYITMYMCSFVVLFLIIINELRLIHHSCDLRQITVCLTFLNSTKSYPSESACRHFWENNRCSSNEL